MIKIKIHTKSAADNTSYKDRAIGEIKRRIPDLQQAVKENPEKVRQMIEQSLQRGGTWVGKQWGQMGDEQNKVMQWAKQRAGKEVGGRVGDWAGQISEKMIEMSPRERVQYFASELQDLTKKFDITVDVDLQKGINKVYARGKEAPEWLTKQIVGLSSKIFPKKKSWMKKINPTLQTFKTLPKKELNNLIGNAYDLKNTLKKKVDISPIRQFSNWVDPKRWAGNWVLGKAKEKIEEDPSRLLSEKSEGATGTKNRVRGFNWASNVVNPLAKYRKEFSDLTSGFGLASLPLAASTIASKVPYVAPAMSSIPSLGLGPVWAGIMSGWGIGEAARPYSKTLRDIHSGGSSYYGEALNNKKRNYAPGGKKWREEVSKLISPGTKEKVKNIFK